MIRTDDGAPLDSEEPTPTGSVPRRTAIEGTPTADGGVPSTPDGKHHPPTRISASWTAVVTAVILLTILVIFIAENTQRSTVNFLGFHGHAPTAVTLLIAAISGALIVIIVGVARMIQLRKAAKHSGPLS